MSTSHIKHYFNLTYLILCICLFSACGSPSRSGPTEPCDPDYFSFTDEEYQECLKKLELEKGPITNTISSAPSVNENDLSKMVSQTPQVVDPTTLVAEPSIISTDEVNRVGGQFRVSEGGIATYSVSITLPRGTAGVTPQLSLNYSSSSGDGPLGLGWSLDFSGGISRCRQTLLQNAQSLAIEWNENDRFCINGQQLILKSGIYGHPNASYQSEMDSQTIYYSKGGTVGHPDYFRAEGRDGSKTHYGLEGEADSEQRGVITGESDSSGNPVLTWQISRLEDNLGNHIRFNYENEDGEQRIKEIRYAYDADSRRDMAVTFEADTQYGAAIQFIYEYEDRFALGEFPKIHFVNGYRFVSKKLLRGIKVQNRVTIESELETLRSYNLSYESLSTNVDDHFRRYGLSRISECAVNGASCAEPLRFQWGNAATHSESLELTWSQKDILHYDLADLDGDGALDFVWTISRSQGGSDLFYRLFRSSEDAVFVAAINSRSSFKLADFNLDGRADITFQPNGSSTWRLRLSQPDFSDGGITLSNATNLHRNLTPHHLADINADGMLDIYSLSEDRKLHVRYGVRRTDVAADSFNVYGFAGNSMASSIPNGGDLATSVHSFGDFNGDGIVDIVVRSWDAGCTDDGVCGDRRLDVMVGKQNGQFS